MDAIQFATAVVAAGAAVWQASRNSFCFKPLGKLSDFTEGTHPISTKWTTQFSGAKRRSDF